MEIVSAAALMQVVLDIRYGLVYSVSSIQSLGVFNANMCAANRLWLE